MPSSIKLTPEQVAALNLGGDRLSDPVKKKELDPRIINSVRGHMRKVAFGPTLMPTTKQRYMLYPSFAAMIWMDKAREYSRD